MEYKALKDIAKITMGQSPDSSSYNEDGDGMPFFQGNADFGEIYPNERIWCNDPKKTAEPGDILISVRAPIGALNYAKDRCCIGRGLAAITIDDEAERNYVFHLLKAKNSDLNNQGTGSTFKAIGKAVLEGVQVPQISREEQQKCMDMMDLLESIIRERRAQLSSLDELIKARFVEMFGDPIENPMGWDTKPLLSIGKCKNGMNFHYDEEGVAINCLGVGDFKDNSIIFDTGSLPEITLNEMPSDDYLLKDDDIVFVRSNGNKALVGRSVAVYPGETPTTFSGFCIRYRIVEPVITVPYLLRVLKSESVRKKMAGRGANIQNLNQQILGTVAAPIPPMLLQEQFSNFMAQTDKSKVVIQKSLDETQLLFDSLMQKYFG